MTCSGKSSAASASANETGSRYVTNGDTLRESIMVREWLQPTHAHTAVIHAALTPANDDRVGVDLAKLRQRRHG